MQQMQALTEQDLQQQLQNQGHLTIEQQQQQESQMAQVRAQQQQDPQLPHGIDEQQLRQLNELHFLQQKQHP